MVDDAADARIANDVFFPRPARDAPRVRGRRTIPQEEFFPVASPPQEAGWVARAAAKPLRFGLLLFAIGWAGILLQLGFLRQLVVGAPVFEEFAKFGPPLALVALLGARSHWSRIPWAWLSGAGFGVFEHYFSYPEEPLALMLERVAFHAGATGLSMALYTVLENVPDVRARWVSTLPATVLHWVNNFGALVFAFLTAFFPLVGPGMYVLAALVTVSTFVLTLVTVAEQDASRRHFTSVAGLLLPRLVEKRSLAPPLTAAETPAAAAPEPGPPSTSDAPAPPEPERADPPEEPR